MALHRGRCPECGGTVTYEPNGVIAEPVTVNGHPTVAKRAATFRACNSCEWCEECGLGRW